MKVLQISSDFTGSKVHTNLFRRLDALGVEQTVYCPMRNPEAAGSNYFEGVRSKIIYDYVIKKHHKMFYHKKIRDVFQSLDRQILQKEQFDLVHAPQLFSEGAVAYEIFKKYGTPYCVAVRSTDVDAFLRYAPHTWLKGRDVLLNASKIFFISMAAQRALEKHIAIKSIVGKIKDKFVFQPNAIDDFWLNNIVAKEKEHYESINILYVGSFDGYKNVERLIKAVLVLHKEYPTIKLNIVGGGMKEHRPLLLKRINQLIESHADVVNFMGSISDKEDLAQVYRCNDIYAMPSVETFGLVYIEALSQNTPVLFSLGHGIDGLTDKNIGVGVKPQSTESIVAGLRQMICRIEEYKNVAALVDFRLFDWDVIAKKYYTWYCQIVG